MTKSKLRSYKTNKNIYDKLTEDIERLQDQLNQSKIISGQVQTSDEEYPYLRGHMQVEIHDPKTADALQKKIADKRAQRDSIKSSLKEVEDYILNIKDDGDRQIFEWIYLDGMTQEEVGEAINYTQSMISRIIDYVLKDS